MRLVFATNNQHKLDEVRHILGSEHEVLSLNDIGCHEDIPETADTLQGNSAQKALFVWERYGVPCFADDTGLEVEALGGAPGVYSARYAGEGHDSAANRRKLLQQMQTENNRRAQFRTVVTLVVDNKPYFFEGIVKGRIITHEQGDWGFGYDSLFVPDEYSEEEKTFAQLTQEQKNTISHRGRAISKMAQWLQTATFCRVHR